MNRQLTSQRAAQELLQRRQLRSSCSAFIKKAFETVDPGACYSHNWHIDAIAYYLEAIHSGECKRLIINIPPRFMKSIAVTIAFPAWVLGQNPSQQIGAASYSASLSTKHSADCRLIMESAWYKMAFPETIIKDDMNTKAEYETTKQGHRFATSVGGTATGKGGNILITDDPIDPIRAASKTERDKANDWHGQTWSTRLNNPKDGAMVVVMQRLHANDLTGILIEEGGWEHLCIQHEAESRQTITYGDMSTTREEGELLHPQRMGPPEAQKLKTALGSYGYAAQYQQRPAPLGGGMVKIDWFKEYGVVPASEHIIRIVQSWDTAQKAKELNDPTVCTTWAETASGYYLLDVFRERLQYPDLKRSVMQLAAKYSPSVILIEDKSSGTSLIQDLHRDTALPVIAIMPTVDKVTRLATVAPSIEAGSVYLPTEGAWLHDFMQEFLSFPNSVHDDQVDSVSQFLNWIRCQEKTIMIGRA